jgi:hypothetical protein
MARRGPTIADGALELIRERGPQTLEELASVLAERGRTKAKDPLAAVRSAIGYRTAFVQDRAGRWYSLADQLEGAIFTVRQTAFERRDNIVLVRGHLQLLDQLLSRDRWRFDPSAVHLAFVGDYLDLPYWDTGIIGVDDEGNLVTDPDVNLRDEIGRETADIVLDFLEELGLPPGDADDENLRDFIYETRFTSLLVGPPGWLPTLRSREVLGLRVEGGAVRAVAVDRRELSGMHVERAAARIGKLLETVLDVLPDDEVVRVVPTPVVLELVVTEMPEILHRPLPPLPEVIERAGWETDGGYVGPAGTMWEELDEGTTFVGDEWEDDPRLVH